MSAREQEIIDKFRQLDHSARQRVLATIEREAETEPKQATFDYAAWWAGVDALQTAIRARIGERETVGALSLLDELREEGS